jgi:N-acetylglutamate synthase-like GNAT family acetyltransferase
MFSLEKGVFEKNNFTVRNANNKDIEQILSVSADIFGEGFADDLHNFMSKNGVVILVEDNGKIIGFSLGKIYTTQKIISIYFENISFDLEHFNQEENIGVIRTLGLIKSYQKQGIGKRLFEEVESQLKELGAKIIISPAWKDKNNTIYFDRLLKYFSYQPFLTISEYWKEDCEQNKFQCPSKENGKCFCSVVFYKKNLT